MFQLMFEISKEIVSLVVNNDEAGLPAGIS